VIFSPAQLPAPLDVQALFGHPVPRVEADLGCGKGRFLLARAQAFPDTAFVGTDLQYGRLVRIREQARQRGLANIRLLHAESRYVLEYLFPPASLDVLYLFFPDPWPKRRHHRRRLVQASLLPLIYRVLKPSGLWHIATDHADYFTHIRRLLDADPRFLTVPPFVPSEAEKTDFERIFEARGLPIYRCSVQRTA